MKPESQNAIIELALYLLFSAISVAIFFNARTLPTSTREPLGSATMPQIVSVIILVICAALSLRAVAELRRGMARNAPHAPAPDPAPGRPREVKRYGLATCLLIYSIAFVGLLQMRIVPARFLAPLFLFLCIWTLLRFRKRSLLPAALVAGVIGYGTSEVFSHIFYINLP